MIPVLCDPHEMKEENYFFTHTQYSTNHWCQLAGGRETADVSIFGCPVSWSDGDSLNMSAISYTLVCCRRFKYVIAKRIPDVSSLLSCLISSCNQVSMPGQLRSLLSWIVQAGKVRCHWIGQKTAMKKQYGQLRVNLACKNDLECPRITMHEMHMTFSYSWSFIKRFRIWHLDMFVLHQNVKCVDILNFRGCQAE